MHTPSHNIALRAPSYYLASMVRNDSPPEVVQVTRRGLWLAVGDDEYFLDFDNFPWFRKAPIEAICEVEEVSRGHFHWSKLDSDLEVDTILQPVKFNLVDRAESNEADTRP